MAIYNQKTGLLNWLVFCRLKKENRLGNAKAADYSAI